MPGIVIASDVILRLVVKLSGAATIPLVVLWVGVLDVITCEEPMVLSVSPSDKIIFSSPVLVFGNNEPTVKLTGSDIGKFMLLLL